jgi:two-component system chemotaxis response regulator CheB
LGQNTRAMATAASQIGRDIVVIGASAGGVQFLIEILRGLSPDLPASLFVVLHTSPTSPGILPHILDRAGPLHCLHPVNREKMQHGRVYVAPPDHHLLLKPGQIAVAHGPKENGFRPAVDPLFRTAAAAYGPRVIGIILSGGLDDGTLGLAQIKLKGGVGIVQDPDEAMFPSMPASAIRNVQVEHIVPVADMPALIERLAREPLPQGVLDMARQSNGKRAKHDRAEEGATMLLKRNFPGPASGLICPECGGALWEGTEEGVLRYQCHVGHAYTSDSLMAEKEGELESTLWAALRALEENADLRRRMARRMGNGTMDRIRKEYEEQAEEAEKRAAILRRLLIEQQEAKPVYARPAGANGDKKKGRRKVSRKT